MLHEEAYDEVEDVGLGLGGGFIRQVIPLSVWGLILTGLFKGRKEYGLSFRGGT